jgi:hypothetical protein
MSFWSLLFVLGVFGFAILVAMKLIPIYLNQMKVTKVVRAVAQEMRGAGGEIDPNDLRRSLEKRWDIEDIDWLEYQDIKLTRVGNKRSLKYDYEARKNLFQNIFIVVDFQDDVLITNSAD